MTGRFSSPVQFLAVVLICHTKNPPASSSAQSFGRPPWSSHARAVVPCRCTQVEAHLVLVEPQVASVVASPRDAPPFVLVAQAVLLQKAVEVARNVADRSVVVEDVAVPRLVDQLTATVDATISTVD